MTKKALFVFGGGTETKEGRRKKKEGCRKKKGRRGASQEARGVPEDHHLTRIAKGVESLRTIADIHSTKP